MSRMPGRGRRWHTTRGAAYASIEAALDAAMAAVAWLAEFVGRRT